ncbi:MAG: hypothetical protein NVS3B27_12720 [Novosphingobium sp.]
MVTAEAIGFVDQQHRDVLAPASERKGNQPAGEPATEDRDICPFFSHSGTEFRPGGGQAQPAVGYARPVDQMHG